MKGLAFRNGTRPTTLAPAPRSHPCWSAAAISSPRRHTSAPAARWHCGNHLAHNVGALGLRYPLLRCQPLKCILQPGAEPRPRGAVALAAGVPSGRHVRDQLRHRAHLGPLVVGLLVHHSAGRWGNIESRGATAPGFWSIQAPAGASFEGPTAPGSRGATAPGFYAAAFNFGPSALPLDSSRCLGVALCFAAVHSDRQNCFRSLCRLNLAPTIGCVLPASRLRQPCQVIAGRITLIFK